MRKRSTRAILSLALFVAGCATGRAVQTPPSRSFFYTPPVLSDYSTRVVNLCDTFDPYIEQWKTETARRFPGAVLLCGHGLYKDGEWFVVPDYDSGFPFLGILHGDPIPVKAQVLKVREEFPDRIIVLLICNPGHVKLDVPNIAYPMESVWLQPDKELSRNKLNGTEYVGNIFEFTIN